VPKSEAQTGILKSSRRSVFAKSKTKSVLKFNEAEDVI